MPYRCKTTLPGPQDAAKEKLIADFADHDWAVTNIRNHAARCHDDVVNIRKLGDGLRVLNIGGAPYTFEALAASYGMNVTSLDLDPDRHRAVVDGLGIDVISANIEEAEARASLPLADFDVLVICEVFEHMRIDLITMMKDLHAGMAKDAVIYLTTPNFYFARKLARYLAARRSGPSLVKQWGKLEKLGHMGHVREYSRRELTELFEYCGFTVQSVRLRNRGATVRKAPKAIVPTTIFTALETQFDLFAQDLVYVLGK